MILNYILLQDAAAQGGGLSSIIMIVTLIAIFYFFMIRPQSKKQKEMRKFREAMKEGDRVTTAGGIHGKVRKVNAEKGTILLEIADNVKITIDQAMVYPSAEAASQDVANSEVKK